MQRYFHTLTEGDVITEFFEYVTENALILIPVLLVIGKIIKSTEKIRDKWIPLILLPLGIAGALALGGLNIDSAVQGVLVTGAAVYGNQLVKQLGKQ